MDVQNKYTQEEIQNHIIYMAIFIVCLILLSLLSLWYQIHRWKRIRQRRGRIHHHHHHNTNNNTLLQSTANNNSQHRDNREIIRNHVQQIKSSARSSRQKMHEQMEKEIEGLRLFQLQLKDQVDMLRVAFATRDKHQEEEKTNNNCNVNVVECHGVGDAGVMKKEQ